MPKGGTKEVDTMKERRASKMDLSPALAKQLAVLARRHGARRLVLFGSRARGDGAPRSDVDLAVYGMPEEHRAPFWLEAEELPTLLKLDIVHVLPGMNEAFLRNIETDGVILYAEDSEL